MVSLDTFRRIPDSESARDMAWMLGSLPDGGQEYLYAVKDAIAKRPQHKSWEMAFDPAFLNLIRQIASGGESARRMAYDELRTGLLKDIPHIHIFDHSGWEYKLQTMRDGFDVYNGLILAARELIESDYLQLSGDDIDLILGKYYPFPDWDDELALKRYWPKFPEREQYLQQYIDLIPTFAELRLISIRALVQPLGEAISHYIRIILTRTEPESERYSHAEIVDIVGSALELLELTDEVDAQQLINHLFKYQLHSIYTGPAAGQSLKADPKNLVQGIEVLQIPRSEVVTAWKWIILSVLRPHGDKLYTLESVIEKFTAEEVAELATEEQFSYDLTSTLYSALQSDDLRRVAATIDTAAKLGVSLTRHDRYLKMNSQIIFRKLSSWLQKEDHSLQILTQALQLGLIDRVSLQYQVGLVLVENLRVTCKWDLDTVNTNIQGLGLDLPVTNFQYIVQCEELITVLPDSDWTICELLRFVGDYPVFAGLIQEARESDRKLQITAEIVRLIPQSGFLPYEIELILQSGQVTTAEVTSWLAKNKGYDRLYEILRRCVPPWVGGRAHPSLQTINEALPDAANFNEDIASPIHKAVLFFSPDGVPTAKSVRKVFKFLTKPGMSRHDILQNMNAIIDNLAKAAADVGVLPRQFFGNIMNQVLMDGRPYGAGKTSVDELGRIAGNFDLDKVAEIFSTVRGLSDERLALTGLAAVKDILAPFTTLADVFADWRSLRAAEKAIQMFAKKEILLQVTDREGDEPELAMFLYQLLRHPDISFNAIDMMINNPRKYLSEKSDQNYMPIRYAKVEGLQWDAEDIVSALHSRSVEHAKRMPSMAVRYLAIVPPEGDDLAAAILTWVDGLEIADRNDFLAIVPEEWGVSDWDSFRSILGNADDMRSFLAWLGHSWQLVGERFFPDWELLDITAEESMKSSPVAQLGGNDTNSCMAFGRKKTVQYVSNMGMGIMVLTSDRGDDLPLVVTQSVSTEDVQLPGGVDIDAVRKACVKGNLTEVLVEDFLIDTPKQFAYDNAEVITSWVRSGNKEAAIREVYDSFAREYLARYAAQMGWNPEFTVLGRHADDELRHVADQPNGSIPGTGMIYSDKTSGQVARIGGESIPNFVVSAEVIRDEEPNLEFGYERHGNFLVRDITYSDAIKLAYLAELAGSDDISFPTLHESLNAAGLYASYRGFPATLGKVIVNGDGEIIAFTHFYWGHDVEEEEVERIVITDGEEVTETEVIEHLRERMVHSYSAVHPRYRDDAELDELLRQL